MIGAFAKLLPPQWRTIGFGAGTAAGSFGQFLFSPLAVALIDNVGWQNTLLTFAAILLVLLPLSLVLSAPPKAPGSAAPAIPSQSVIQALAEALGHRSYVLLILGYFTCGFQLFFITVHLPAYLVDRGLPASIGGWTIAVIGLFNIFGSIGSGYVANLMPKRYLLSAIYFSRSLAILVFILLPPSPAATLIFGAVMGLLWLSTIPPTSALVAIMFGNRWLTMLLGLAFFSHQVGGFLGVWLGGVLFERTGSYDVIWWGTIFFGVASAIINLPIVEQPVAGPARLGRRHLPTSNFGTKRTGKPDLVPRLSPSRVCCNWCRNFKSAALARQIDSTRGGACGEIQGDRGREGRQGPDRQPDRVRRSGPDGRRRHRPGRLVDHQLQGRPRHHRQGAGGAPLPDDPRHRFRGRGGSLLASGLEARRQGHPQRLGHRRDPSRRLCGKGAREGPVAGAAAGRP